MKKLNGIHHVTAITSNSQAIYDFYNTILGMRLVKKNVNQDDLQTYHLYFADDQGRPGTDMTFFDFRGIGPHQVGTDDISKTTFRVPSDEAIEYWVKRFQHYHVKAGTPTRQFGRLTINFEDFDHQHYALVSDEGNTGVESGEPWHKGPVPDEYAITGLGPIHLRVRDLHLMDRVLVQIMEMRKTAVEGSFTQYEMGDGGNGGMVIVEEDKQLIPAVQGYGGVHHVAFRVDDREQLDQWINHMNDLNLNNSGFVDRFYFKSLYFRLYPNILFELATDGPGFIDDEESYEILGETLTLPPHLRGYRETIEKNLKPFDTVRSTKVFTKEYFNE